MDATITALRVGSHQKLLGQQENKYPINNQTQVWNQWIGTHGDTHRHINDRTNH